MASLDFYYSPASSAPVKMQDGDFSNRHFTDTHFYCDFFEYLVREGNDLLFYYCYHQGYNKTTFFIYPSKEMSDMFSQIIRNLDKWNLPSVKEQWPHFAKAYSNGEENMLDKIVLKKIPDWERYGREHIVFMITLSRRIEFEPTYTYREIIHKLVEFANMTINEVLDDNGCLNTQGQMKSFLRGAFDGFRLSKLLRL